MARHVSVLAGLAFVVLAGAGGASASDASVKARRGPHAPHGLPNTTAPRQSLDQIRSELYHGSAAQREMEHNDNDRISRRPVDHTKDEFFSDWKGIQ